MTAERHRVDDEAAAGLSLQARYCDPVAISQASADEVLPRLPSDFPEFVLLNCARPLLVAPAAGRRCQGQAWKAGPAPPDDGSEIAHGAAPPRGIRNSTMEPA
ncbi:hypothetical protein PO883_10550 [Massilia sp. DJPM01]|uniref:hypothetical protein n=1 Tax=Massilia sp. DJPM01 TaxID=3024404 RepID=UPI00259F2BA0|nr:hypothetical protein [Massilia sp. DJPM01]MDM5177629.1 hypothetical protein [Massilia sp. DJPM01]